MAKNIFFEEICDGVLYEAAESFEDEVNLTNTEEEAKTVEKSHFVELFCCFYSRRVKSTSVKQMKKPKLCITLW